MYVWAEQIHGILKSFESKLRFALSLLSRSLRTYEVKSIYGFSFWLTRARQGKSESIKWKAKKGEGKWAIKEKRRRRGGMCFYSFCRREKRLRKVRQNYGNFTVPFISLKLPPAEALEGRKAHAADTPRAWIRGWLTRRVVSASAGKEETSDWACSARRFLLHPLKGFSVHDEVARCWAKVLYHQSITSLLLPPPWRDGRFSVKSI